MSPTPIDETTAAMQHIAAAAEIINEHRPRLASRLVRVAIELLRPPDTDHSDYVVGRIDAEADYERCKTRPLNEQVMRRFYGLEYARGYTESWAELKGAVAA